jgi:hypothetical protein
MDLSDYVGMTTGIVGAITGIVGAVWGYKGYAASNRFKSQDLRLQLRKGATESIELAKEVRALIDRSDKSRIAVASASGFLKSSRMVNWKSEVEAGQSEIDRISEGLPLERNLWSNFSDEQIENEIIRIHGEKLKMEKLRKKFEGEIAEDDERRNHIREQAHKRLNP